MFFTKSLIVFTKSLLVFTKSPLVSPNPRLFSPNPCLFSPNPRLFSPNPRLFSPKPRLLDQIRDCSHQIPVCFTKCLRTKWVESSNGSGFESTACVRSGSESTLPTEADSKLEMSYFRSQFKYFEFSNWQLHSCFSYSSSTVPPRLQKLLTPLNEEKLLLRFFFFFFKIFKISKFLQ